MASTKDVYDYHTYAFRFPRRFALKNSNATFTKKNKQTEKTLNCTLSLSLPHNLLSMTIRPINEIPRENQLNF